MCRKKWLLVGGVSLGLTLASPAKADLKYWQGGDLAPFSVGANWVQGTKPGSSDRAINEETERIKFDDASGGSPYTSHPYVIDEFHGDSVSDLVFERYNDDTNGTSRALQVTSGFLDPPNVNDQGIFVGRREALWVGDVLDAEPSEQADILGYAVTADGKSLTDRAYVGVSRKVGPGTWSLRWATVGVGYPFQGTAGWNVNIGHRNFPFSFATGIDSDVTDPGSMGDSPWSLSSSWLQAKRAVDLDTWTIRTLHNQSPSRVWIHDYLEARVFDWEDLHDDDGNLLVYAPEAADPQGLRVLRLLKLHDPPPHGDWDGHGPYAKVGELVVKRQSAQDDPAEVSLQTGAWLHVTEENHEDETEPPLVVFDDESVLWYGCEYPDKPNPPYSNAYKRNALWVFMKNVADGVLQFKGDSYIARIDDLECDDEDADDGLLVLLERASFDIQSEVSSLPARNWFTGKVDVTFGVEDELDFEVIAPNVCNLWFVDVPEPRCVKYWQHLYVHHGANVTLVDEHDNHVCGTAGTPKDGALYVLGELEIDDNCSIDHGDIAVYYATSDEATLGRLIGSVAPEQLLYTVYGDFDGDCCVDVDDYDWIVGYLSWYNSRCDWPLADYTGDCLVNASDVAEVLGRYASFTCYSDDACPYQSTSACNFAPGDGPEQGGQESENVEYIPGQPAEGITALASAMVGYLVSRDPQDSGEEDTVQHMIDSFDKLTAMYFDADQKGALADSLEQADYASDTVAELTATLVTKLRG